MVEFQSVCWLYDWQAGRNMNKAGKWVQHFCMERNCPKCSKNSKNKNNKYNSQSWKSSMSVLDVKAWKNTSKTHDTRDSSLNSENREEVWRQLWLLHREPQKGVRTSRRNHSLPVQKQSKEPSEKKMKNHKPSANHNSIKFMGLMSQGMYLFRLILIKKSSKEI